MFDSILKMDYAEKEIHKVISGTHPEKVNKIRGGENWLKGR